MNGGGGKNNSQRCGVEVSGQTDKRYLVESGQIMKFRGGIEMGENDDLDRLYFG